MKHVKIGKHRGRRVIRVIRDPRRLFTRGKRILKAVA